MTTEMLIEGFKMMWWVWGPMALALLGTCISERGERLEKKRKKRVKKTY